MIDRVTRLMVVLIAALAGAILLVREPEPPPPSASPPVAVGGDLAGASPGELNRLLCLLMEDPGLALRGEQADRVVEVLQEDRAVEEELNPLWMRTQVWSLRVFTDVQLAYLAQYLGARDPLDRPPGGPLNDALFRLLAERSGTDPFEAGVEQLLGAAEAAPFAQPEVPAAAQKLHPEDLVGAVVELPDELALTKEQAVQLLPFVRVQTDLYRAHQRNKERVLALLTPEQQAFMVSRRGDAAQRGVEETVRAIRHGR